MKFATCPAQLASAVLLQLMYRLAFSDGISYSFCYSPKCMHCLRSEIPTVQMEASSTGAPRAPMLGVAWLIRVCQCRDVQVARTGHQVLVSSIYVIEDSHDNL
jgi:hypothetical protein